MKEQQLFLIMSAIAIVLLFALVVTTLWTHQQRQSLELQKLETIIDAVRDLDGKLERVLDE